MKNNQSGRSMVEMLGVLAIVSLLSIITIVGYIYLSHSHRTSKTLNELSARYNTAFSQVELGRDSIDLSEFSAKTSLGYQVTSELFSSQNYFDFKIENLDKDMCEAIVLSQWINSQKTYINQQAYQNDEVTFCTEGENTIIHRFAINGAILDDIRSDFIAPTTE